MSINYPIDLNQLYLSKINQLYKNSIFREVVLTYNVLPKVYSEKNPQKLFERIFLHHLQEAASTLKLLQDIEIRKNSVLLEVGAGLGFTYGYLKKCGYKIHALEPSVEGFENLYQAALEMFKELKIDNSGWHPYLAEDAKKIKIKADVIFSHNTLEHILNLKTSLQALKAIMKKSGLMIHGTVNYLVPYEPHYKIFLVPFIPRLTGFFKPWLNKQPTWQNLNFITPRQLKKIVKACDLKIHFKNGILVQTLQRLETEKEFAQKHNHLIKAYSLVKKLGGLKILSLIPPTLKTPIVFTLRKN